MEGEEPDGLLARGMEGKFFRPLVDGTGWGMGVCGMDLVGGWLLQIHEGGQAAVLGWRFLMLTDFLGWLGDKFGRGTLWTIEDEGHPDGRLAVWMVPQKHLFNRHKYTFPGAKKPSPNQKKQWSIKQHPRGKGAESEAAKLRRHLKWGLSRPRALKLDAIVPRERKAESSDKILSGLENCCSGLAMRRQSTCETIKLGVREDVAKVRARVAALEAAVSKLEEWTHRASRVSGPQESPGDWNYAH